MFRSLKTKLANSFKAADVMEHCTIYSPTRQSKGYDYTLWSTKYRNKPWNWRTNPPRHSRLNRGLWLLTESPLDFRLETNRGSQYTKTTAFIDRMDWPEPVQIGGQSEVSRVGWKLEMLQLKASIGR